MTINQVNLLLTKLADDAINAVVDAEYEEMVFEMFAGNEQMLYASQSYTNDSIAYGEMV
jgi:hypothetical protein